MERLCGQCAWNDGGRWCRKKYKDVAYFAQEPCFTTDEEYHSLLAEDIIKDASNAKKLTSNAKKMESNTNITTKVCKVCGKELPIDQFRKNPKCKDGRLDTCYECLNKKVKKGIVQKAMKAIKNQSPESDARMESLMNTIIDNDVHLDEKGGLKAHITGEKLMEALYKSDLVMYEDGTIKMPLDKIEESELVAELRKRGWDVTCTKVLSL